MKHDKHYAFFTQKLSVAFVLILLIVITGCSKDIKVAPLPTVTTGLPPASPPTTNYKSKIVWATEQPYISHISGSATLKPHYHFLSNIKSYRWRKVDGPANYKLSDSTGGITTITNLEVGVYKFEIHVTEENGNTDSDTFNVYVIKPGVSEVIFPKMQWICPMGCSTMGIEKIYSFIPRNKPLKVFLKYEDSDVWKELLYQGNWTGGYEYIWNITDDNFSLYADYPDNEIGRFDVKIQY